MKVQWAKQARAEEARHRTDIYSMDEEELNATLQRENAAYRLQIQVGKRTAAEVRRPSPRM